MKIIKYLMKIGFIFEVWLTSCINITFKNVTKIFFDIFGLLICTLISENQGLEKSRSASNLRKISGPANLDFFQGLHLEKKLGLYYKPEKKTVRYLFMYFSNF